MKVQKGRPTPLTLSIPAINYGNGQRIDLNNNNSSPDIHCSVRIQDIPPSPTQHAEFTLALNAASHRRRHRKRGCFEIHACFDISNTDGTVTVVSESDPIINVPDNCTRYERDSMDLLDRFHIEPHSREGTPPHYTTRLNKLALITGIKRYPAINFTISVSESRCEVGMNRCISTDGMPCILI